jgi:hypothetical protein
LILPSSYTSLRWVMSLPRSAILWLVGDGLGKQSENNRQLGFYSRLEYPYSSMQALVVMLRAIESGNDLA